MHHWVSIPLDHNSTQADTIMRAIGTFILLLITVTFSKSQSFNTENGFGLDFWTDTDSWDNGVPTCGSDPLTITIDQTIIIRNTDVILNCEVHITVTADGVIRFANNSGVTSSTSLQLGSGSSITLEAGAQVMTNSPSGTHENNSISINGTEVWNGAGDNDFVEDVEITYVENTTLPIELASFDVEVVNAEVEIGWTTSTEINNDYFTVFRSVDGHHFEELARVEGAGNSNQVLTYTFEDENPLRGTSYYRLRQTDYDGKFEEFEIVSVEYTGFPGAQIEIYPNPCVEKLICRGISSASELRILDENGREVTPYVSISPTSTHLEVDVTRLRGGAVYLLKAGSDFVRFVKK